MLTVVLALGKRTSALRLRVQSHKGDVNARKDLGVGLNDGSQTGGKFRKGQ